MSIGIWYKGDYVGSFPSLSDLKLYLGRLIFDGERELDRIEYGVDGAGLIEADQLCEQIDKELDILKECYQVEEDYNARPDYDSSHIGY